MLNIEWMIRNGPCKKFTAGGEIPCRSGQSGGVMYILISGRVGVSSSGAPGNSAPEREILPGEAFGGYEFFFQGGESVYTAIADSITYVISENSFQQLAQTQPQILFEVLKAAYAKPGRAPAAKPREASAGADKKPDVVREAPAGTGKKSAAAKTDAEVEAAACVESAGALLFPEGHKAYPSVTMPESAKFIFSKEYKCPFCGKAFNDYKVFHSKLYQAKPVRYDLRKYYTDFQAEWYDIITCRHCYFSTYFSYFTETRPLTKGKIEKALSEVKQAIYIDFAAERDVNFVFTSHYLALACAAGYTSSEKTLRAKIWGNISWLYEDVEDEEMTRFAAGKAAEAYEAAYTETNLSPVQEQATCLTIAGMLYRAGKSENLKNYLYNAKTNRQGNKMYADLAEDLMEMLGTEK